MKIKRFKDYYDNDILAQDFIEGFDLLIKESDQTNYEPIRKKVFNDLKLNSNLALTYGAGMHVLYPIVAVLLKNMKLSSIDITADKIILLTVCAFTIIYLEEKNSTSEELRKDSKSMLEELKMGGIGNGIVKKLVETLKSFTNIFNIIYKHIGKSVSGLIDMFTYVSLLIPIMNGILFIIGKYDLNIDTFLQNFTGLLIGVGSIITKQGISYIIDKIKVKVDKKKILSNIDTSIKQTQVFKPGEKMINEQ